MARIEALLAEYWPHFFFALSLVLGTAAAVHAAMTKHDVRAAIAWVGVVVFSPMFGPLLYFIAGVNRVRRERRSHRRDDAEVSYFVPGGSPRELDVKPVAGPQFASLKILGDKVSVFPLTGGNAIAPLDGGDQAYPAMLQAIRRARRSIALQTYIFDSDPVGREIAQALIEAHARGVEVRVLIDAIGSTYSRPPIHRMLTRGGVRTALFMSKVLTWRLPYANLRSHRKILVVDAREGFTGGMNIRAGFTAAHTGGRPARDAHFRLEGPVVSQLLANFFRDWHFTTGEDLNGHQAFQAGFAPAGDVLARCVPSGPNRTLGSTHDMLLGALAVAQRRVCIQSPYFLPDQPLIGALATAARRGIQVDIVIPGTNNLRLVNYAMTAQLDQVIRTGCRVWRARGPFDHSKLLAVDGAWCYVGSSNLDPRSLRLNFELDVELYDPATARWIESRIDRLIADARPETLATLAAQPFVKRLRNRVIWLASPYL